MFIYYSKLSYIYTTTPRLLTELFVYLGQGFPTGFVGGLRDQYLWGLRHLLLPGSHGQPDECGGPGRGHQW